MNVSIEEKIAEGVERLKLLGVYYPYIERFAANGRVMISETSMGRLSYPDVLTFNRIKKFEKEHNSLVYFVIRDEELDTLVDYFFVVGNDKGKWALEKFFNRTKFTAWVYFSYLDRNFHMQEKFARIDLKRTLIGGLVRKEAESDD